MATRGGGRGRPRHRRAPPRVQDKLPLFEPVGYSCEQGQAYVQWLYIPPFHHRFSLDFPSASGQFRCDFAFPSSQEAVVTHLGLRLAFDRREAYRAAISSEVTLLVGEKRRARLPFWAFLDSTLSEQLSETAPVDVHNDPLRALATLVEIGPPEPMVGLARSIKILSILIPESQLVTVQFDLKQPALEAVQAIERDKGDATILLYLVGKVRKDIM